MARILTYIADLFESVQFLASSAKFMPGMLYAAGGLMKVEARNYLETKTRLDSSFVTPGPIRDENP